MPAHQYYPTDRSHWWCWMTSLFSHSPPVRSSSVIYRAAWGGRCKSLLNGDIDAGSVHSSNFTIMLVVAQLPCRHVTVALMQRLYFQWTKSIKMAAAMWTSCNTACMFCSITFNVGPEREVSSGYFLVWSCTKSLQTILVLLSFM